MLYYRIVVWTGRRRLPYQGIRWIESHHITMVQGIMEKQAVEKFKSDFIDREVQMLSKTCSAVKKLLDRMNGINK
jgi:phage-related minor tail protein